MTLVEKRSKRTQLVAYALIGIMLAAMGYGVGVWSAPVTSFGIDGSGNLNVNGINTNTLRLDTLTSGRVPIAGTAGLLDDSTAALSDAFNNPELTASYVVWVDGATYYAKNGHTGAVTSNANAATLFTSVFAGLTPGRTWYEKVVCKGTFMVWASIDIPSYTIVEGGKFEKDVNDHVLLILNRNNVILRDIEIDGNKATYNVGAKYGIYIIATDATYNNVVLENIKVHDVNDHGVHILGTAANWYGNIRVNNLESYNCGGSGIFLNRARFIDFEIYAHDNVGDNIACLTTNNVNGRFIVSNSTGGHGAVFSYTTNFQLEGKAFNNALSGVVISDSSTYGKLHAISYNNAQVGINIDTTHAASDWDAFIEVSGESYNNTFQGLTLEGANYVTVTGGNYYNNTLNGINISNSHNITIINAICYNQLGVGCYGIAVANTADYVTVRDCNLLGNTLALLEGTGTHNRFSGNLGHATENSGTATLLNTKTTIAVTHGLSYTPDADDITITFTEIPTNPITGWKVGTFTASTFNFTSVDPGASNLDFSWSARKTP
jgi:hypothetical protein